MRWSDINLNPAPPVLRQFAAAWLLFLSAWGLQQWLLRGNVRTALALASVGILLGGLGLLFPAAIRWLYAACTVIAFPLGWLVSQVVLLIMFYGIITPVALIFKIIGRDVLCRKHMPMQETYWKPKAMPRDVRRYFRQY